MKVAETGSLGSDIPARNLYWGIFLTSAAVIILEISLTRIFSYTIWYHFTYVTISLAMLGFGASGAVLSASQKLAGLELRLAGRSSLIAAISVPIMLIVISKVPFYPFRLFREPVQLVYMILYYVTVTLPFFCAGLTIACAFRSLPQKANTIYFWDLVGAGMGCLVVVTAIKLFGVPGVAAICASLFFLAIVMFVGHRSRLRKSLLVAVAIFWIPMGLNIEQVLEFKASPEKYLSKMGAKQIDFFKWSPIFRVDSFESPHPKLGPDGSFLGIKRQYIPDDMEIVFIAHDGDACARMIKSESDLSAFDVFEKSILKAPYILCKNPKVLIIGPGGGVDVGIALKSEARSVLAVELDPITVDLVEKKYGDFTGHLYDQVGVKVVVDEGRSFLRRSHEKFDLIQMTGVDTLAALSSGAYVLAENYLYTTEAYCDFMDHLNPEGILSIANIDYHYDASIPRFGARQMSLFVSALKKKGITEPYKHIAVLAAKTEGSSISWLSMIAKMSPFTPPEIAALRKFADDLSFEIWYLPGEQANNPCALIVTSTEEKRAQFYMDHPLQLRAPTDEAPFYYHFYKWKTLIEQHEIDTGHTMATGQLILLLILVMSVAFSVVLIIFPLFGFQRAGLQTKWKWHYIFYFAALGLGFIFLEICYIQKFILFLGYPTLSLTVLLFALLTFSGVGAYLSGRLPLAPRSLILIAFCLLAVVALGYIVVLPPIFDFFLGASKLVRIAVSVALLFPLGLLLGVFFPTGVKIIAAADKRFVPWAWGINGCASVIGTVLSIIIAMTYGFGTVTVLAVIIYMVGVSMMIFACKDHPATR